MLAYLSNIHIPDYAITFDIFLVLIFIFMLQDDHYTCVLCDVVVLQELHSPENDHKRKVLAADLATEKVIAAMAEGLESLRSNDELLPQLHVIVCHYFNIIFNDFIISPDVKSQT